MRVAQNQAQNLKPHFADRVMLWFSKGEQLDGLWIGTFDQANRVLPRLREALQLIKTHDPLRYTRLTRDLKRIWVFSISTPACFNYRLGACQLDERFVLAETTTSCLALRSCMRQHTRGYGIAAFAMTSHYGHGKKPFAFAVNWRSPKNYRMVNSRASGPNRY
jgi:hypothetical protein